VPGPAYRIEFAPGAARDFRKLDRADQARLAPKIDSLRANPRPHGVETLSGAEGLLRIRVGNYRVVYQVRDDRLLVLVVRVGHRRDVYRRR
jgi:mRNA interferase RelE/StbE